MHKVFLSDKHFIQKIEFENSKKPTLHFLLCVWKKTGPGEKQCINNEGPARCMQINNAWLKGLTNNNIGENPKLRQVIVWANSFDLYQCIVMENQDFMVTPVLPHYFCAAIPLLARYGDD